MLPNVWKWVKAHLPLFMLLAICIVAALAGMSDAVMMMALIVITGELIILVAKVIKAEGGHRIEAGKTQMKAFDVDWGKLVAITVATVAIHIAGIWGFVFVVAVVGSNIWNELVPQPHHHFGIRAILVFAVVCTVMYFVAPSVDLLTIGMLVGVAVAIGLSVILWRRGRRLLVVLIVVLLILLAGVFGLYSNRAEIGKTADVWLTRFEQGVTSAKIEELQKKLEAETARVDKAESDLANAKVTVTEITADRDDQKARADDAIKARDEISATLQTRTDELAAANKRVVELNNLLDLQNSTIDTMNAVIADLKKRLGIQ